MGAKGVGARATHGSVEEDDLVVEAGGEWRHVVSVPMRRGWRAFALPVLSVAEQSASQSSASLAACSSCGATSTSGAARPEVLEQHLHRPQHEAALLLEAGELEQLAREEAATVSRLAPQTFSRCIGLWLMVGSGQAKRLERYDSLRNVAWAHTSV